MTLGDSGLDCPPSVRSAGAALQTAAKETEKALSSIFSMI